MRIGRFLSITNVDNRIITYHKPSLLLTCSNLVVANNTLTPIPFDTEIYDELGMWAIGDPTNINTPSDAIWTISVFLKWLSHVTGIRYAEFGGIHIPDFSDEVVASDSLTWESTICVVEHIDHAEPFQLIVSQTRGDDLTLLKAQLMMVRQVVMDYPV